MAEWGDLHEAVYVSICRCFEWISHVYCYLRKQVIGHKHVHSALLSFHVDLQRSLTTDGHPSHTPL